MSSSVTTYQIFTEYLPVCYKSAETVLVTMLKQSREVKQRHIFLHTLPESKDIKQIRNLNEYNYGEEKIAVFSGDLI